jgi:hypothetical protein
VRYGTAADADASAPAGDVGTTCTDGDNPAALVEGAANAALDADVVIIRSESKRFSSPMQSSSRRALGADLAVDADADADADADVDADADADSDPSMPLKAVDKVTRRRLLKEVADDTHDSAATAVAEAAVADEQLLPRLTCTPNL